MEELKNGNCFFPSCKAKADYRQESSKLAEYIRSKYNVSPIGCCRIKHQILIPDDMAIVVCNNCAAVIEKNISANIKSVWEILDEDKDFIFPDYGGEKITVQDCRIAYEKRHIQDAIRSLLKKMIKTIGILLIRIKSRLENYERRRIMESILREREYRY